MLSKRRVSGMGVLLTSLRQKGAQDTSSASMFTVATVEALLADWWAMRRVVEAAEQRHKSCLSACALCDAIALPRNKLDNTRFVNIIKSMGKSDWR